MPIASNFLIPNGTFIVEIVAFIVVLAVVARKLLPPLQKALDERQERIRSEMAAADEARADAVAAEDERRRELESARQQAREILARANRAAEHVGEEAESRAQAEYERIVSAAEVEVHLARQRAVDEAAARMGELVLDVVERVIGREVSAEAHRDLIDEAVAALSSEADTPGHAASGAGAGA